MEFGHEAGEVEVPEVSRAIDARKQSVLQRTLVYSVLISGAEVGAILPSQGTFSNVQRQFWKIVLEQFGKC